MPAVDPSRLNFQIADLMSSFHAPEEFHQKIRDLFSLYANRTLRQGAMTDSTPLMPAFHLPEPVFRQLRSELAPATSAEPNSALKLADTLWQDEHFEVRQIAVLLLGHVGPSNPEPILSRLNNWLSPDLDPVLKEFILQSGTQHLQSSFPAQWEAWIGSLLSQKEPAWIALGLAGLRASLGASTPQNLPAVFRMVSPFIRDPQPDLMNALRRLVKALATQSPTETAYFLKQTLSLSSSSGTERLVRQSLPLFSDDIQIDLNAALKLD